MSKRSEPKIFFPCLADVFFICVFLVVIFFKNGSVMLMDGDTGYHIRAGEYFIDHLAVSTKDIFSYREPALDWTAHEWLSEVLMGGLHRWLGLTGVVFFFSAIIAWISRRLYQIVRSECDVLIAIFISLFAVATVGIGWMARPHILSLFFFLYFYENLEKFRKKQDKHLLIKFPLAMLIWVNLHGGYVMGFLLMTVYLISALLQKESFPHIRRLLSTSGLCLLAVMLNPTGWRILTFPFKLVSNKYIMDHFIEFGVPDFHAFLFYKYYLLLLIGIFLLSRKRVEIHEFFLISMLTYMSLYSLRHSTLFAVITAPVVARHLQGIWTDLRAPWFKRIIRERNENLTAVDKAALNGIWPIAIMGVVFVLICTGNIRNSFSEEEKPVKAIQFIQENKLKGNVYNNDEFGDLLIYYLWPQYKVFFDGRGDMYGAKLLKEYLKVEGLEEGWEDVFKKYQISWVFFYTKTALSYALSKDPDWRLIYSDKLASIFVRNSSENAPLIQKYAGVQLSR